MKALPLISSISNTRTDIWVMQRRCSLCFALEPGSNVSVAEQMGRQKLESNLSFQLRVLGLVDDTHAAFAELLGDLVMGDGLANHRRSNSTLKR